MISLQIQATTSRLKNLLIFMCMR